MDQIKNNLDISIIMPVYNSERYIKEAISPILAEKNISFELILVNDASTDKSLEIIKNIAREDDRIKIINLEKNSRQGTARNKGLDIAKGKYILFVDSDDILHTEAISKLFALQEQNQSDVCAFAYRRMIDRQDGQREYYFDDGNQRKLLQSLADDYYLNDEKISELFLSTAGVCNNLFSKNIIDKYNIRFPENLIYEDNYFVKLYMFYVRKYSYLNEVLYDYREHDKSTTKNVNDSSQFDRLKIEDLKLETFKKLGLYGIHKDAIDFDYLRLYYLNSIGLFMLRDKVPYNLLKDMRKKINRLLPEIRQNKYFNMLRKEEKFKFYLSLISFRLLRLAYKIKNK